jgi:hypothetical protein
MIDQPVTDTPLAAIVNSLDFLDKLASVGMGVEYAASGRTDGISNQELLRIHAEDGVTRKDGRNIKRNALPDERDVLKCAEAFAAEIEKHLARVGEVGSRGKVVTQEAAAKQAGAAALKRCGIIYRDALKTNIEKQQNADGSRMETVEQDRYAKNRKRLYNIAESIVFQASSQLVNAVNNGKFTVYYDRNKILKMLSIADGSI